MPIKQIQGDKINRTNVPNLRKLMFLTEPLVIDLIAFFELSGEPGKRRFMPYLQ